MISQFPDIKGKRILVTGALGGIGRGLAQAFAANHARIAINYRSRPEEAQKFCQELRSLGAEAAYPLGFDVTNYSGVKAALEGDVKEHGPITGIVNNAGISQDRLLLQLKEDDIHSVIDTNLKGAIYVTQALGRSLLKAKGASIVNISSIIGLMGNPGQTLYAASKAGLLGMTRAVARELGSRQIRCNAICPGFIDTQMTKNLDDQLKETYLSQIPLKSFGIVDDVSNLVLFLISEASSYITGEVIRVDGGMCT